MVINKSTIEALRNETKEIIKINPIDITFIRSEKKENRYGSIKTIERNLNPQFVRLAELSHSEKDQLGEKGLITMHSLNITALHDADIQKGDKFDFYGVRYVVQFIRPLTLGGFEAKNIYRKSGIAQEILEEGLQTNEGQ